MMIVYNRLNKMAKKILSRKFFTSIIKSNGVSLRNHKIEKLNNSSLPKKQEIDAFIFFKSDKKIHKVDLESIHYIEAVGDYMKVITDSGQLLINETMKNLQEELPAKSFIRVHKSFIISRNRIKFIEGNYIQVENKSIPIGATYRNDVLASTDKKS